MIFNSTLIVSNLFSLVKSIIAALKPDIRNGFSLPSHLTMGNFSAQGGDHSSGTKSAGKSGSGLASYVAGLIDR